MFNEIEWHDGRLLKCELTSQSHAAGQGQFELKVSVYKNKKTGERVELVLSFSEISRIILTCDFSELFDNYKAGNINDGYKKNESIYRLYLIDGYIEIHSTKLVITD